MDADTELPRLTIAPYDNAAALENGRACDIAHANKKYLEINLRNAVIERQCQDIETLTDQCIGYQAALPALYAALDKLINGRLRQEDRHGISIRCEQADVDAAIAALRNVPEAYRIK